MLFSSLLISVARDSKKNAVPILIMSSFSVWKYRRIISKLVTNDRALSLDSLSRWAHQKIPLSVQHYLREKGLIRYLNDFGALSASIVLLSLNPSLLWRFLLMSRTKKTYRYGDSNQQVLEVYDWTADGNFDEVDHAGRVELQSTAENKPLHHHQPVVLFVHGGAWGSGLPWQYRLTAAGIGHILNAGAVIVIGYPVYPATGILDQRDCVLAALDYIHAHEAEVVISPTRINRGPYVLVGHSSGANINALAIIQSAVQRQRKLVDVLIGLGGVYDIVEHYQWERNRGVHEISPMAAAAKGKQSFPLCSPTLLIREQTLGDQNKTSNSENYPYMVMIHGDSDTTVPFSSSKEFAEELSQIGVPVDLVSYPVRMLSIFVLFSC